MYYVPSWHLRQAKGPGSELVHSDRHRAKGRKVRKALAGYSALLEYDVDAAARGRGVFERLFGHVAEAIALETVKRGT